ncbi:2'-5' RNA ligase family protein [Sphingomonas montanisoli]|uniref:2'-5' RNA ligase n=1 Tax=Sphingomonas montanisoli TaxID=2606412 RepID=A0A5D9CBR1_9SPHN|nr:2'-5' RNA ligase family protein [Sphingomonas montanisoli]TZG27505.1 hypothetical protein FYJ91_07910 [Sphingomonas montanisoli]
MTKLRSYDTDELILHRLFFALRPSEEAIGEIAAIRDGLGPVQSHIPDEKLHMTLFVHNRPTTPDPDLVERMSKVAAKVAGPGMRVALGELIGNGDNVLLRPGDHMPVLGAFRDKLAYGLAVAGVPSMRGYRFDPHVTIAYGMRDSFRRTVPLISWRSDELVLVHSLVGLTEHRILGRWKLGE